MFSTVCRLDFPQHAPLRTVHIIFCGGFVCFLFICFFGCFLLVCRAPARTLTGAWTSHTPRCNCQLQILCRCRRARHIVAEARCISISKSSILHRICAQRRSHWVPVVSKTILFGLTLYDKRSFVLSGPQTAKISISSSVNPEERRRECLT